MKIKEYLIMQARMYLLAVAILCYSCDLNEDKDLFDFTIQNESGKDIEIRSYKTNTASKTVERIIEIESGDVFFEQISVDGSDSPPLFSDVFRGDSITVNFENERILSYCQNAQNCLDVSNNVFLTSYRSVGENHFEYKYDFTPTHYQNADPID